MNVTTWVSKKMRGDKTIRYVALFLVAVSLIAVYTSASALVTNEYGGNTSKMLMKHLATIAIGLVAMLVAHFINYKHYAKIAPLALIPIWILLVYTTYRGQDLNNASRTISIFKLSFQPSEWAKIILITYLAQEIYRMGDDIHNFKKVIVNLFLPSVITIAPILPENLSTALILFAAVIVTLFVGRVKFVHLLAIAGICVCLLGAYLLFDAARTNISNKKAQKELATSESSIAEESSIERTQPSTEPTSRVATWNKRLQTIFDEGEPFDKAHYQKTYAKIAVASSNVIGKGPGKSEQRNFLPEAYCDFIYAIIIEEYGIVGAILVMMAYIILFTRVLQIYIKHSNTYGANLAFGLTFILVLQAMVNMGVSVGLLPVTGQPLPFVSMGGSSMMATGFLLGMLLSITRGMQEKESEQQIENESVNINENTDERAIESCD